MRTLKDWELAKRQAKTDAGIERVFRLMRKHRDSLEPKELRDAFDRYAKALTHEVEREMEIEDEAKDRAGASES